MDNAQQTIFIGNLPFNTDQNQLQDVFGKFGIISNIHIPTNRETGRPRGFAFIQFETESAAEEALTMNDAEFNGRNIKVNIALGKKETPRPRTGGNGGGRFGNNDRRGGSSFGGRDRY